MCKYCECKVDEAKPWWGCKGAEIVPDYRYIGCTINYSKENDTYSLCVIGEEEGFSDPISFCPFCGKKLK